MKLQRRYQLNLLKTISILAIPFIIILFLLINYFTQDEVKELLDFQTESIIIALKNGNEVKSIPPTILVESTDQKAPFDSFLKVPVYDILANETEEYYESTTITKINNENYKIIVRATTVERMDLFFSIFFSTLVLILGLGGIFYFFNNRLFDRLLQPFRLTLSNLKNFSLSEGREIDYVSSDIDEFDELSKVTSTLGKKVITDYQNLKQFTENASHEIQTPLAIIRNKLEHIINQENLSIEMSREVQGIDSAVNKLSSINKGLLLLAKIENHQFSKKERVDLGEFIGIEILDLEELYFDGKEAIEIDEEEHFIYNINPILAEILVRNLMKNMITHSSQSSIKKIQIKENSITFINNGDIPIANKDRLFTRFYKESTNEKSIGLGLAIAKAICDQYGLEISYNFENGEHRFGIVKVIA